MIIYYFNAFLKGVLEGVTEFLPISSTGHLILARKWFPLTADAARVEKLDEIFDIVIQFPAILAVVILFRRRLWESVRTIPSSARSKNFWLGLILAFLPAAVIGKLFHATIEEHLMKPVPVALALIVGGIILIFVDRGEDKGKYATAEDVPLGNAFFIGVFQCFGMIPGTSRSGATIVGGRLLHLTRFAAAEYSFFLAIPTMFAAFAYKLLKEYKHLRADEIPILLIGAVTSFIVAWIVVKWLIHYVQKNTLEAFGYYRIVLGAATLIYVYSTAGK